MYANILYFVQLWVFDIGYTAIMLRKNLRKLRLVSIFMFRISVADRHRNVFSLDSSLQIKFFIAPKLELYRSMVQSKSPHLSIKFIGKRNHNPGYVMVKEKRFLCAIISKLRFQCIEYTTSHMFWLLFHIQLVNIICNI